MGSSFLEKIAPYYFLLSSLGCISLLGTIAGLVIYATKGKQLQAGTRQLYLVMALWTILINAGMFAFITLVGGDPSTAAEVESM